MSSNSQTRGSMDRRQFARGMSGAIVATLWSRDGGARPSVLPPNPLSSNEKSWNSVRQQFSMPSDLAVMNAANLCPSSVNVMDCLVRYTRDMDRDPSFPNRLKFGEGKE